MPVASPVPNLWAPNPEEIFRITVDRYERMIALGDLDEDDRIELLNGVLVKKVTRNPPHLLCCDLSRDELARLMPVGFWIRSESPIRVAPFSVPEPDVTILRGGPRDFASRLPTPTDVVLCLEVAESSLARDRVAKRDLYAQAGIPVYWVVNLVDRRVEVFAGPKDGAYTTAVVVDEAGSVEVVVDGEAWGRIEVAAILP